MKTQINTTNNVRVIKASPAELVLRVRCHTGYQCAFVRMKPGVLGARVSAGAG